MSTSQPLAGAPDSLGIAPLSLFRRLLGRIMAWGYRLIGKHRYDNFRLERVQGMPLIVMPSVFNPKVPRTGTFLAAQIHERLMGRESEVLDLGTGSGVCALVAARHARRVVAVDINLAAIRCAHINAQLNRLEHKIDLRHGDLFAPVSNERFDFVLFNPPFLLDAASDDRDRAWRSNDIPSRFASELGAHLKPGGVGLLVLSTFGDAAVFLRELRTREFEISLLAERHFINERLAIFRLAPSNPDISASRSS